MRIAWVVWIGMMFSVGCVAAPVEVPFYYPIAVHSPAAEALDGLVQEFNAAHQDSVVRAVYGGTYQETVALVLAGAQAGSAPPAAVLFAVDIYSLLDAGLLLPFDDLVKTPQERAWLDSFPPALMANSQVAGKTWGIPLQRSTILLYWNKKHFREAGLDAERPPATWGELAEDAQRLTTVGRRGSMERWGVAIPTTGFPYWMLQGLSASGGTRLAAQAGNVTYFDALPVVSALEFWRQLIRSGSHPAEVEWGRAPKDFVRGKFSMLLSTSGNLAYFHNHQSSLELGVAALPAQGVSPTGGGNFYVFRDSSPQQQRAALDFIRWMTAPEQTARWSMQTGYLPVTQAAWEQPALREYAQDFPAVTVASAQLARAIPELATHENQRVTRVLNAAITAVLKGTRTPQAALHDAQAQAVMILRPYRR